MHHRSDSDGKLLLTLMRERRQHTGQFSFTTDTESEQYCRAIVAGMVQAFGISQSEARRHLNAFWKGEDFVGMDLRYHRGGPEDWVYHFQRQRMFEK